MPETAARLREAAYALFEQQGYAATTVDQIAARAGVGRSTFFRAFGSKEDVIFPDHDALVARVAARVICRFCDDITDKAVVVRANAASATTYHG